MLSISIFNLRSSLEYSTACGRDISIEEQRHPLVLASPNKRSTGTIVQANRPTNTHHVPLLATEHRLFVEWTYHVGRNMTARRQTIFCRTARPWTTPRIDMSIINNLSRMAGFLRQRSLRHFDAVPRREATRTTNKTSRVVSTGTALRDRCQEGNLTFSPSAP